MDFYRTLIEQSCAERDSVLKFFGQTFVKRFVLCCGTVVLSVTLVYCGQMVGWIKMLHGTEVGLGPGDIVLDGDAAPSTERGTAAAHFSALYCGETLAHLSTC